VGALGAPSHGRPSARASLARVKLGQELVADLVADLEAPIRFGVFAARLSLGARLNEDIHRFALQALEQFHQVVLRHGQVERLALVLLAPTDVLQQPEVFGELLAKALGGGAVLGPLHRDPEILDEGEVIANHLIEPVALVAVDGDGRLGH
jgi:hypothetical protein